ncbi:unnamed protein product [Ixodes hexagonus]
MLSTNRVLFRGSLAVSVVMTCVLIYNFRGDLNSTPLTILLWTTWSGKESYPYFKEDIVDTTCPQACLFTRRRSHLKSSAAILFHGKDIHLDDMPNYRSPQQRWIFFSLEPPTATPLPMLKKLDGFFNMTMTYRQDSDVTTFYGYTVQKKRRPRARATSKQSSRTAKPGAAVWMVSHCKTDSRRETYVSELQKVLPVDIYGKCGKFVCEPKASDACYRDAAKNYSFYLSFENSICRDYVTEKFFRPLLFDLVPVVMGGGDYFKVAPPGSFIDALDFKSPAVLGAYLKRVAEDPKWYKSYFLWKDHFQLKYEQLGCKLCSKLHSDIAAGRTFAYNRFHEWFLEEARCTDWKQLLHRQLSGDDGD